MLRNTVGLFSDERVQPLALYGIDLQQQAARMPDLHQLFDLSAETGGTVLTATSYRGLATGEQKVITLKDGVLLKKEDLCTTFRASSCIVLPWRY